MEKEKIIVPGYVRYMSEWEGFELKNFPRKCIINKQLPGCGFTEFCIRNNDNIILAIPRKFLGRNKYDQHKEDVYLVVNEMEKGDNIDKDISKQVKDYSKPLTEAEKLQKEKEEQEGNSRVYLRIQKEITEYCSKRYESKKPMKIIVTYDSYRIVQQILKGIGLFNNFYTVIDEFQSILHDARFKSCTENQFMRYLSFSSSAIFLSATPMLDDYLEMLSDFCDLPYYVLDWETDNPGRVKKPHLEVRTMKSVGTKAKEILEPFLRGEYKSIIRPDGNLGMEVVESKEVILYVNSVNHIISIIRDNKIPPERVNIICADTEENRKKIKKKLGKKYDIGSIPLKGDPWKDVTICTRTAYLGVDFYSTCATTYIFSDSNIDSLAVDISEDLPQILGRLRDERNPWHNSAYFYYRSTADYRKMTVDDFRAVIEKKQKDTDNLLKAYKDSNDSSVKYSLAKAYQTLARMDNYRDSYVGVDVIYNDQTGDKILVPGVNELVFVNELRAFQIQQIDYADRFTVFSTVHNCLTKDDSLNEEVHKFLEIYYELPTMYEKLKMLCEYGLSPKGIDIVLSQLPDSDEIKNYYNSLGPDNLKRLGYNKTNITRELGIVMFNPLVLQHYIYLDFKEGERLTVLEVKERLKKIYNEIGYKKTPKATDILEYFNIKDISIYEKNLDGSRKRIRGYELLSKKDN